MKLSCAQFDCKHKWNELIMPKGHALYKVNNLKPFAYEVICIK